MGEDDDQFSKYRLLFLSDIRQLREEGEKLEGSIQEVRDMVTTVDGAAKGLDALVTRVEGRQDATERRVGTLERRNAYSRGKMAAVGASGGLTVVGIFELIRHLAVGM